NARSVPRSAPGSELQTSRQSGYPRREGAQTGVVSCRGKESGVTSDGKGDVDQMAPGLVSLLDSMDQAVIVQDASGRIQLLNAVAQMWFPDLEVGKEFDQKGDTFVAEPAGFRVCGRLRRLVDEWQAWVITEVSGEVTGETVAGETAHEASHRREFLLFA